MIPALEEQLGAIKATAEDDLIIPIRAEGQQALPLGPEVPFAKPGGDRIGLCALPPLSQLWRGSRQPPAFTGEPPKAYLPFFLLLERTAADYSSVTGKPERDAEFERLYRLLKRRPDGSDANPLFSYLQGAARLYCALHEVSRAEFEAVAARLERSARTFTAHEASTNYFDRALAPLLGR